MHLRVSFFLITGISLLVARAGLAYGDPPATRAPADPARARAAIERGLSFLQHDAAKWRQERKCATCHHGTMTVWALCEAKSQGYAIAPETLAEMTAWTGERLKNLDKPRDRRPGWNMVSTPAVFLALMTETVAKQDSILPADLKRIAGHLVRHQEADGSWAWSIAPPGNRPPPVFESDEVVTLMAYLALGPQESNEPAEPSAVRTSRDHAAAWLAKVSKSCTTQATALRLFRDVRAGKPPEGIAPAIDRLLQLQHKDGGWGQQSDFPSDGFATGQALYFLSLAGVAADRPEIERAVAFLVASQRDDGSWPMKSHAHPGAKPYTNPVPITYFGSAWATMGLMRVVTK